MTDQFAQGLQQRQQPIGEALFTQSILDKLREDCVKLKAACIQLKQNEGVAVSTPNQQVDGSQENEEATIQKWLAEKKLLRVKTELESNEVEGLPVIIVLRLFAILVYKNDERSNEIKQILIHFLAQIEQEFVKILVHLNSKAVSKKEFIDQLDQGKSDSVILFTLLSFIFRKNIRFYYLKNQSAQQNSESVADTGSSGSIFNEINLVSDLSPEQVFLKFYIRGQNDNGQQRIFFDLICNEFEYEIMYRKTFTGATQGIILQDDQNKHKRGNSNGMSGQNPMMFNSPGHNMGMFGSPNQINPLLMQQQDFNAAMMQPFQMQNSMGGFGGQASLLQNPQAIMLLQQQQEELQKLIMLKQQTLLLQQQQLLMPQMNQQHMQGMGGMNGMGGMGGMQMMAPPGLGMGQQLPMQIHSQGQPQFPMKAMHHPSQSYIDPRMKPEQVIDKLEIEESKFNEPDEYQVTKRQSKNNKHQSMDISSKAFIPTKKFTPQRSGHNPTQSFQQPLPPGLNDPSKNLPNAYDVFNQPKEDDAQSASDFRVSGRLKFFSEGSAYGFVVSDIDNSDLFFHYDDMKKTNLSKQFLKDAKNKYLVRLTFKVMAYYGKYNLSKKAVDLELIKIEPLPYQPGTQQATIDHLNGRFPGSTGLEHAFNTQMNINAAGSSSFISSNSGANLNSSFISNGGL